MRTRFATVPLGGTGLEITRLGFGTWAIGGGGWRFGWGPQVDDESIAAIHHALDQGVNWIDTSAAYGLGRSEEVVGRALAGMPADDRPYVFATAPPLDRTGRRIVRGPRRDSILREVEGSLRRLGVDAIDLYQVHRPIQDREIEERWAALAELKEQGLVRHIGVCDFTVEQVRRAARIAPVETLHPPYSLIDRAAEADLLPFAERDEIGVIVHSPMGSGLLTGAMTHERISDLPRDDWRRHDERFREPRLSRHLGIARRLAKVADRHHVIPGAVAVAWTLRNPAVDATVVGLRRPDQVDPVLTAAELELDDADLAVLGERW